MRSLIENVLGDAGVGGEQLMETSGLKLRELLVWQVGGRGGQLLQRLSGREGREGVVGVRVGCRVRVAG